MKKRPIFSSPVLFVLLIGAQSVFASEPDGPVETLRNCLGNSDCISGQFCSKKLGECQQSGKCVSKANWCADEKNPVCGCDLKVYSNPCDAALHGQSIKSIDVKACEINK